MTIKLMYVDWAKQIGLPILLCFWIFLVVLCFDGSLFLSAVVHEGSVLGSDGESIEPSPCTSDEVASPERSGYVVNVKMRQKPNRRWSEVRWHSSIAELSK